MNSVAVVLLNFNNYKDSVECIQSLLAVDYEELSIVLVDNKSTDDSFKLLTNDYSNNEKVTLLQSGQNKGFSFGNNIGIVHSIREEFDYIMLLNNDTVVDGGFLCPLVEAIEEDSDIGCVTGKGFFYDKPKILHMCGGELDLLKVTYRRHGAGQEDLGQFDTRREVGFASCYFFMAKREVFEDIGLLNEGYFGGTEEVDFMLRLSTTKWKIVYEPRSRIWHKIGGSFVPGGLPATYMSIRNKLLFVRENFSPLKRFTWTFCYFIYCMIFHIPKRSIINLRSGGVANPIPLYYVTFFAFWFGLFRKSVTLEDYEKFKRS